MSKPISMTEAQTFGNEVLTHEQIKALKHEYKSGRSLTNLEIEKLLQTVEWSIGEVEHLLKQEVS